MKTKKTIYLYLNYLNIYKLLLTILIVTGCSTNDEESIPENAVFEPQTELISLDESNNELMLQWKPVIIEKFLKYKIYRLDIYTDAYFNPSVIVNSGQLIKEIDNNLLNSFTDTNIPFNSFIAYAVVTEYLDSNNILQTAISINYKSYENVLLSFEILSLEKQNDGTIKVTWEKDNNDDFESYTVHIIDGNTSYSSSQSIIENGTSFNPLENKDDNILVDNIQYKNKFLLYAVSKKINGRIIYSKNYLSINNPRNLGFKPSQVLKNPFKNDELIIFNPNGEIVFFDINNLEITSKVELNNKIFHSSIGSYNGEADLYIPSKNGKIYIIDLDTYSIKETIDLDTDNNIISAIPINDYILFIEKHFYSHVINGGTFVYDRINNTVLNRDNGSHTTYLNSKLFNAYDNYFFSLTYKGFQHYDSRTATRKLTVNNSVVSIDYTFNGSYQNSLLFALSPDKTYFISTTFGYQSSIDYQNHSETTVGRYSESNIFGDAKISNSDKIYLTVPDSNSIYVFNKNNFSLKEKEYQTSSTPVFIELFENKIILVNQFEANYYIETIVE
ncbi:PQQ-binding-like beta-propeller repeat protein [Tenacibaculum xiamenense]|uniref:hypothetical protein n=1 Tax=Tenacibaculum xiamenense TaxID=1261553 RepID=UPI003894C681